MRWDDIKAACLLEQRCYLFIPKLRKPAVELANCEEVLRRIQADNLVGLLPQLLDCVRRRYRNREHKVRWLPPPSGPQGNLHRRSGGDAVINNDSRAPGDVDRMGDHRTRRGGGARSLAAPPISPVPDTRA